MVGVGGAVPHYSNYKEHVRLGDVVVSMPSDDTGVTYVYCSKVCDTILRYHVISHYVKGCLGHVAFKLLKY